MLVWCSVVQHFPKLNDCVTYPWLGLTEEKKLLFLRCTSVTLIIILLLPFLEGRGATYDVYRMWLTIAHNLFVLTLLR